MNKPLLLLLSLKSYKSCPILKLVFNREVHIKNLYASLLIPVSLPVAMKGRFSIKLTRIKPTCLHDNPELRFTKL